MDKMDKQTQAKIELLKRGIEGIKDLVQTESSSIYPQVAGFAQRINAHLNDIYEIADELNKEEPIHTTNKHVGKDLVEISKDRNFEIGDVVVMHNPLTKVDKLFTICEITDFLIVCTDGFNGPRLNYTKHVFLHEKNKDGRYLFEKVEE